MHSQPRYGKIVFKLPIRRTPINRIDLRQQHRGSHMVNEEQFLSLLQRMEDETLDFKARGYDLTDEGSRFSFVKDVLCMANTPRDTTSFIVLGVKKYADGSYDL